MRRNSFFRNLVHCFCADLNFNHPSFRADNGSVNRLITVLFRDRDIILKAFGNRFVHLGHHAVNHITIVIIGRIENNPDRKKIVNFLQRFSTPL